MKKFKKFLESVSKGNAKIWETMKTVEGNVDVLRSLAGKYNKIAEWCGLPQIPSIFTK